MLYLDHETKGSSWQKMAKNRMTQPLLNIWFKRSWVIVRFKLLECSGAKEIYFNAYLKYRKNQRLIFLLYHVIQLHAKSLLQGVINYEFMPIKCKQKNFNYVLRDLCALLQRIRIQCIQYFWLIFVATVSVVSVVLRVIAAVF